MLLAAGPVSGRAFGGMVRSMGPARRSGPAAWKGRWSRRGARLQADGTRWPSHGVTFGGVVRWAVASVARIVTICCNRAAIRCSGVVGPAVAAD